MMSNSVLIKNESIPAKNIFNEKLGETTNQKIFRKGQAIVVKNCIVHQEDAKEHELYNIVFTCE
jgi:hypothetical protein